MIYSYGTSKFLVCYNILLKKPQDNCDIETIVRNFGKRQKNHQGFQTFLLFCCKRIGWQEGFLFFCRFSSRVQISLTKPSTSVLVQILEAVLAHVAIFVATIALNVDRQKIRNQQFVYTKWIDLRMNKHQKTKKTQNILFFKQESLFLHAAWVCARTSVSENKRNCTLKNSRKK